MDKAEWANDVAAEMARDNEIGETMLCRMLDEAMQAAMDNGSTGLHYK